MPGSRTLGVCQRRAGEAASPWPVSYRPAPYTLATGCSAPDIVVDGEDGRLVWALDARFCYRRPVSETNTFRKLHGRLTGLWLDAAQRLRAGVGRVLDGCSSDQIWEWGIHDALHPAGGWQLAQNGMGFAAVRAGSVWPLALTADSSGLRTSTGAAIIHRLPAGDQLVPASQPEVKLYIVSMYSSDAVEVAAMQIVLSQVSGVPLYEQIVEQILREIVSGRLAPGTPLPSLRALASELRVSLITTTRAYNDLAAGRWIVNVPGKGSFVAEIDQVAARAEVVERVRADLARAVHLARGSGLLGLSDLDELVEEEWNR